METLPTAEPHTTASSTLNLAPSDSRIWSHTYIKIIQFLIDSFALVNVGFFEEHLSGYKWGCLKRVRVRYLKKKAMVASTIDVKDEEEQKIVNTSGKIFIEKYLLSHQHDDYHMLLRYSP
ncbi:hypothetical protein LXL04_021262 [Taraxacum kok-saghyz]